MLQHVLLLYFCFCFCFLMASLLVGGVQAPLTAGPAEARGTEKGVSTPVLCTTSFHLVGAGCECRLSSPTGGRGECVPWSLGSASSFHCLCSCACLLCYIQGCFPYSWEEYFILNGSRTLCLQTFISTHLPSYFVPEIWSNASLCDISRCGSLHSYVEGRVAYNDMWENVP